MDQPLNTYKEIGWMPNAATPRALPLGFTGTTPGHMQELAKCLRGVLGLKASFRSEGPRPSWGRFQLRDMAESVLDFDCGVPKPDLILTTPDCFARATLPLSLAEILDLSHFLGLCHFSGK